MTWLDILCLLLVLAVASVASWQGTLRTTVALVGFYFGGKLTLFLARRLAHIVHWHADPHINAALLFTVVFVFVAVLVIVAAYLIEQLTQFSLEEADHLVAFPLGLVLGMTLVHWVVQVLAWGYADNPSFILLMNNSPIARELLTFQATKGAIARLFQWSQSP